MKSHLAANDYYCEGESVVGRWIGEGAALLSLNGQSIDRRDAAFEALRQNRIPGGLGKLTPRNDNEKNSVRFFDFQCSAQKSVSVMAVVMQDQRLYEAHDRAAAIAFSELERFAGFRTGVCDNRTTAISGNLCAAAFRHDASRSLDPQLHTHFVVANATWDAGKKQWKALDTFEMFKAIRYAGKVYQNELALECRRLGYSIEAIRNGKGVIEGFEIAGVSKDIREKYSKRRAEIEAGIARFEIEKGRKPTVKEISVITRETRGVKLREITTAEVREQQRQQLTSEEFNLLQDVKLRAMGNEGVSMGSAWSALKRATEHVFERESVVHGHKVLAEALNRGLGFISLDKLRELMTGAKTGLIQLTQDIRNPLLSSQWTSDRNLHLERWAVEFVNQTQDSCSPLGKTKGISFDFKSAEQRRVVLETLNNRDRVYAIRGRAGTGKTTALGEIRKGLEAAGRTVYYLAPVSSAVEVLKKDGFTNAVTVAGFLANRPENLRDAVVIIDESSLQSNELGSAVMDAARNARILFVGDTRQHVSVEAGDFLRILEKHSKVRSSELKDIRRQDLVTAKEYNRAVRTLSDGKAVEGMKQIDDLGWIENARGLYIEHAADEYIARTENGTEPDNCIAISPTWRENHLFTDAIRKRLKERELIGDGIKTKVYSQLDWTKEQRADSGNYMPGMFITFAKKKSNTFEVERVENGELWLKGQAKPIKPEKSAREFAVSESRDIELSIGDKVLIRRNHHDTGLINGNVLTIDKINNDGSIETREGKHIPAEFRHFAHGYVVTSHKSQGRSHKYEVVASERLDAVAAYVALSRGRKSARVFTPDKENLFENLGKPTDRLAALDVLNKERKRVLHRDEEKDFRQSVKNPLTAVAIQYAQNAAYGIDYGGDFAKYPLSDFQPMSDFKTTHAFEPGM